ncbi:VanZ family protein [Paenibacillus sp. MMO-177]|uniref:VanZ family protein n=1 Tax=Paenibacillus sp. MMO-177 TaxID=3081289 RepID=UPI003FA7BD20
MVSKENQIRGKRIVIILILLVYLLILFKVVLFKVASPLYVIESMFNISLNDFNRRINLGTNFVPFKTISNYLFHTTNINIAIKNIIGNLIIFVPFGWLLPMVVRNKQSIGLIITVSFY